MRNHLKGFTLIELLVVIAIIGILATLVITQLGNARTKAIVSGAKSDVTEAGKAIEVYKLNNESGPVLAPTAGATLPGGNNPTATGGFTDIFDNDDYYKLTFSKTSGNGATYTYRTSTASATIAVGGAEVGYVFSTTLPGEDDDFYSVNGTTVTGTAPAAAADVPTVSGN